MRVLTREQRRLMEELTELAGGDAQLVEDALREATAAASGGAAGLGQVMRIILQHRAKRDEARDIPAGVRGGAYGQFRHGVIQEHGYAQ